MPNPNELPIACTLSPEALAARKADLLGVLAARAVACEVTNDGMTLRFDGDALAAIASVVDAERKCCRFLRFDIRVEPDGGPVALTLSGPPGTGEFLAALLDA